MATAQPIPLSTPVISATFPSRRPYPRYDSSPWSGLLRISLSLAGGFRRGSSNGGFCPCSLGSASVGVFVGIVPRVPGPPHPSRLCETTFVWCEALNVTARHGGAELGKLCDILWRACM